MAATEPIEKAIQELEAQHSRLVAEVAMTEQLLGDLRTALARARNGTATTAAQSSGDKAPFTRKYEENARALIVRCLNGRKGLHVGQIEAALKAKGYEYLKATIALNLKHLREDGVVRQIKAPKGSGYTYAWILEKDRPAVDESQEAG